MAQPFPEPGIMQRSFEFLSVKTGQVAVSTQPFRDQRAGASRILDIFPRCDGLSRVDLEVQNQRGSQNRIVHRCSMPAFVVSLSEIMPQKFLEVFITNIGVKNCGGVSVSRHQANTRTGTKMCMLRGLVERVTL